MVLVEMQDHRGATEPELVAALRGCQPLALAEAYYRTIGAAYGCARRLLGSSAETEALLRAVYAELWDEAPSDEPLEGWIRQRCYTLGIEHLREVGRSPASWSAASLVPELGEPVAHSSDRVEEALAALDEPARHALLLAHDQGVASAAQDDPEAAQALDRGLAAIAGTDEEDGSQPEDLIPMLGDWTLGLLPAPLASEVEATLHEHPDRAARARLLRRGRRRLEGLPPPSDMGQRVLVAVLATAGIPSGNGRVTEPGNPSPPAAAAPAPATGAVEEPAAGQAEQHDRDAAVQAAGEQPINTAPASEEQQTAPSPVPRDGAEAGTQGIVTNRGLARGSWQRGRRSGGLLLRRLRGGMLMVMVVLAALSVLASVLPRTSRS